MDETAQDGAGRPSRETLLAFAERPSPEYDEILAQADYLARAKLSFYRFRALGGRTTGKGEKISGASVTGHGYHYVTAHPDRTGRYLAITFLALLTLFDSAANAYFFSKNSEFGLLGGMFQAAAVSLANVTVSFFIIGYWGLRHITVPIGRPWSRRSMLWFSGLFAIIAGVTLVVFINLAAAHYRNILDLAAEGAALPPELVTTFPSFFLSEAQCNAILGPEGFGTKSGAAAASAMCRPTALTSLDAMVLFALGIGIAAIAAFEGRNADHHAPGLSNAARAAEKAIEDLQFALEDYYDAFEDVLEDVRETLEAHGLDPKTAFSMEDEMALRARYDQRIARFRVMLDSDRDLLSDEFAIDPDIVDRVLDGTLGAGKSPGPGRRPAGAADGDAVS